MSPSPVPAVIAVIVHKGRTLLVRRANPPDAGLWGFPGGKIEFGETVKEAATRELLDETGVVAQAQDVITTLDILVQDPAEFLRFHSVGTGNFRKPISQGFDGFVTGPNSGE